MTLQTDVRDLLLDNIRPEYAENSAPVRQLIRQVCSGITDSQALGFLQIYDRVSHDTPEGSARTRRVRLTSTEPIGISFYDSTIVKGRSHEVTFCGLPTRTEHKSLEFYLSAVASDPLNFTVPLPDGSMRSGFPVRRGIRRATSQNLQETVDWAARMYQLGLRNTLAHYDRS